MKSVLKWWAVYPFFFALIGFAVYITDNGHCLWALAFTPGMTSIPTKNE